MTARGSGARLNKFVQILPQWKYITRCGASELWRYWWRGSVTACVCSAAVSEAPQRVKSSVLIYGSLRRATTCSATKTIVEQVSWVLFCLLWFKLCDCGVEYHPSHAYTLWFSVGVAIHYHSLCDWRIPRYKQSCQMSVTRFRKWGALGSQWSVPRQSFGQKGESKA